MTGVNLALRDVVSPSNLLIVQLIPVVIAALFLGRAASVLTAAISILLFDLLFVPPYYTLAVSDWEYFISFVGYLVVALVISILAGRLRHLLPQVRESEATVEAVAGLSRDLEGAATTAGGPRAGRGPPAPVHRRAGGRTGPGGRRAGPGRGRRIVPPRREGGGDCGLGVSRTGRRPVGVSTRSPRASGRYLPLVASGRALGVVGVIPGEKEAGRPETCSRGLPGSGRWSLDRLG